jgi:hypothetical protein
MKVAARLSDQENDALEWATDFFRKCAAAMTHDGSKRQSIELGLNTLVSGYDFEVHLRQPTLSTD